MAVYNGSAHIARQVNSILDQLLPSDLLIIVNDCSNDDTLEICSGIARKSNLNVLCLSNLFNIGPKATFERGLRHVPRSSDFVAFSDQDDIWLPCKRDLILSQLEQYKYVSINSIYAVDACLSVDNPLESLSACRDTFSVFPPSQNLLVNLIKPTPIGCHLAFRTSELALILPFPPMAYMHDMYVGIHALLSGSYAITRSIGMVWNRHRDSFTPKSTSAYNKMRIRLLYLLCIFYASIVRLLSGIKV